MILLLRFYARGITKMNTRNFNAMVDQLPARRRSDAPKSRATEMACMVIVLTGCGVAFTLALFIAFIG